MAKMNKNISKLVIEKPVVGGSIDVWGNIINKDLDNIGAFADEVVTKMDTHDQEIANLSNEKVSKNEVESVITPIVNNYVENTVKPAIDTYVDDTTKPALDSYEKEKEEELNIYTITKKGELDTHTTAKRGELDTYEKTKETQLNNYTGTKQTQLDSYTNTKKGELDTYTTGKEGELDTHTAEKKSELDTYEETKEGELNTFTSAKKTEITNHTNTKKGELDTYTTQKKGEITTHTDSEIERINADSELAKKQNITDSRLQTESKEIVDSINEVWRYRNYTSYSPIDDGDIQYRAFIDNAYERIALVSERTDRGTNENISLLLNGKYNTDLTKLLFRRRNSLDTDSVNFSDFEVFHQGNYEKNKIMLGNMGVNNLIYIQDVGEKTAGNGYVDKTTGQLYLCKTTNSDVTVTDKFVLATNIKNRDRISVIEEKLGIYHPVGKISTIFVSRDENSSSPNLSFSSL